MIEHTCIGKLFPERDSLRIRVVNIYPSKGKISIFMLKLV